MRFKKKKYVEKAETFWTAWFAWYPVILENGDMDTVWLEWIWRHDEYHISYGDDYYTYRYRDSLNWEGR